MINVYKQAILGNKLIGSVDDKGATFRGEGPEAREIEWHIDEAGQVYLAYKDLESLIGWVEENGAVYARYGRPVSGFYSYPESSNFLQPQKSFAPNLAFQVLANGIVYRKEKRGTRIAGRDH
jgi:hypothetical protein